MSLLSVTILVIIALLFVWGIGLYNALVRLKHGVSKAWSNIDVLLKQRHEELPKLVETCKQYMQHERTVLENVIKARSAVHHANEAHDLVALGQAEAGLRAGLGKLFALAENYPELKANEGFQMLQQRITSLENAIADRRELYNEAVNLNNVRIDQFPDVILARWFNFKAASLLRFSETETADVNMSELFK
ncbi:MAG: LemA family protein [Trichlorobacter sp.]|jgi:LemA protein|nr:LemA family protein [Trichlorobacter sp.]